MSGIFAGLDSGSGGTGAGGFGGSVAVSRLGGACTARASFNSDGSLTGSTGGVGTLDTDTVTGDNYWTPTTTGIGATLWLRATLTSGTFTSGTAGTWQALTTGLIFTRASPGGVGTNIVTATFEIATDSGGANIIASGSITLSAEFA